MKKKNSRIQMRRKWKFEFKNTYHQTEEEGLHICFKAIVMATWSAESLIKNSLANITHVWHVIFGNTEC